MSESLACTTDDLLVEGPALCVNLEPRADLEGRALVTEASCALGVPLSVRTGHYTFQCIACRTSYQMCNLSAGGNLF